MKIFFESLLLVLVGFGFEQIVLSFFFFIIIYGLFLELDLGC